MYVVGTEKGLEYFRHVSSVFKYSSALTMRFGCTELERVCVHIHWSSTAADSCMEGQLRTRGRL